MSEFFAFLSANPAIAWGILGGVIILATVIGIIAKTGGLQTKWFTFGNKLDLVFDYAEFVSRLHDQEYEAIHNGKEKARLETRRSIEHIAHRLVGINHQIYNLSIGRAAIDAYDARFNVTINGQFKSLLIRECMEIFEANHLAELDPLQFKEKIERDWERVIQKAKTALMADWIHVEYSYDTFEGYMKPHMDELKEIFSALISTYRGLAASKVEIRAKVKEELKKARIYIKEHKRLPDGCEDILCV